MIRPLRQPAQQVAPSPPDSAPSLVSTLPKRLRVLLVARTPELREAIVQALGDQADPAISVSSAGGEATGPADAPDHGWDVVIRLLQPGAGAPDALHLLPARRPLDVVVACLDAPESAPAPSPAAPDDRFATAFEHAPVSMALLGLDGRYLDVNRSLCAFLGRSREELLRLRWQDITHPDDLAADLEVTEAAIAGTGDAGSFDKRYLLPDGSVVWARRSATVVRDASGAPLRLVAQIEDITERKRAEQALSVSEARFQATFRRAPIGMAMLDIYGQHLDVNDALCAMVGYDRDELLGLTWQDLTPAAELVTELEELRRAPPSLDRERRIEKHYIRKDGGTIRVDVSSYLVRDNEGLPLHRFAQYQDVSEQRRAEDALRESERRFVTTFESAQIGLALHALDGTRLASNPALSAITGYSVPELLEVGFGVLTHPDDQEREAPLVAQLFAGEIDRYVLEKRIVHKEGHPVPVEAVAALVRDEAGTPLYVLGQLADIGERQRLEAQLQQAAKLEAIGRLAGGVAHDFNNMLLVVRGYIYLLLQRLGESDPARADALEIDRAAERAARLVGQLLAFGRRQALQPRVLDLNEIVLQTEGLLGRLMGEEIDLRLELDPELEPVRADPSQLEQVIVNLGLNSRDATPAGGTVTISTAGTTLSAGAADEAGLAPGRYAALTVADTGTGMDAATVAAAFEPFFTTKGEGVGSGLGLATVHGIVTQSGGGIAIDSAPGEGTSVRVYLPLAAAGGAVQPGDRPDVSSTGETVLVVEDDNDSRALITRVLAGSGYQVVDFTSPVEALAWLGTHQGTVNALVSDVVMPSMKGPELARQVLAQHPEMQVLLVSGYADDALAEDLMSRGARFLAKPFTPDELLTALSSGLGRRKAANGS